MQNNHFVQCALMERSTENMERKIRQQENKDNKQPVESVLVESFEYVTAGFAVKMKETLRSKHYRLATIYDDHYSDFTYLHLQEDVSNWETLKVKLAFEQFAERFRVTFTHYHADNGRFADNAFVEDLKS